MGDARHPAEVRSRVLDLLATAGIAEESVLAVVEAGSTAHAISVGSDDLDFTVVRLETFDELVTGNARRQSTMLRTKPSGVRSEPGDIDLQVYTLRRFVGLATGGNPSVLMILFAPAVYRLIDAGFPGEMIASLTRSTRAASAYLGYMRQQLERWQGTRGQKNVSRPELEKAHGYDTKYAAHTLRLGHQGVEYLTTGRLTLPIPEDVASRIREVRRGAVPEQDALAWAESLERELIEAAGTSTLPAAPDQAALDAFVTDFYRRWYG